MTRRLPPRPRRLLRLLLLPALAAGASCTGFSVQPRAAERGPEEIGVVGMYTVDFSVGCDSCRVEYGREGSTSREVTHGGGWTGSAYLGSLQSGQQVRVVLRVQPLGGAMVLDARIGVNGRTVATGKGEEPGKPVFVQARVGPR
ncbi:MAG: hypothetical protein AMXMBFR53_24930 [Gemmatimonadota bacterium]